MASNDTTEHTKYHNSFGVEVPSCTTIVKLLDKPELVGWANYMGFRRIDVSKYLQLRADYGTACHEIAEQYMNGVMMNNYAEYEQYMSTEEYNEMISKVKYLLTILSSLNLEVVSTELQMHGERFGGTLDLLCRNIETGEFVLLDFKTSKRVYDSHLIQLGGYSMLLEEIYGISVHSIGVILLSKNEFDKNFLNLRKREDNKKNEQIFSKLLDIYWLQKD